MIEELRVKEYDTKNPKDYDTKGEVVAAYQEILHKLKKTKKETVKEDKQEEQSKRVIDMIAKKTPSDHAKHFDALKNSFIQAIEELKQEFQSEQAKLSDVFAAYESKSKQLDELYQIEHQAHTLQALIQAQQEKRREWQQEEQKYLYQRDLAREKDAMQSKTKWLELEQEMELKRRNLEQELLAQQRRFHTEMQEREAKIIMGERELQNLQNLKEKVAQFPQSLQEAVRKAEETLTKQLTTKFDYEVQLLNKEIKIQEEINNTLETKIALLESKITHFESLKNSLNRLAFNMTDPNAMEGDGV